MTIQTIYDCGEDEGELVTMVVSSDKLALVGDVRNVGDILNGARENELPQHPSPVDSGQRW
jgi:hypothetical protein